LMCPGADMRIRLSSPVVRVLHDGHPGNGAERSDCLPQWRQGIRGESEELHSGLLQPDHPYLMPEIPKEQKLALEYPVKVPMMYTNVLIKKWTAFQKLGVSGSVRPQCITRAWELTPEPPSAATREWALPMEPVLSPFDAQPEQAGRGTQPKQQNRRATGAAENDVRGATSSRFAMSSGACWHRAASSPADDIVAITVIAGPTDSRTPTTRWAIPTFPLEERPHVIGRKRFGTRPASQTPMRALPRLRIRRWVRPTALSKKSTCGRDSASSQQCGRGNFSMQTEG